MMLITHYQSPLGWFEIKGSAMGIRSIRLLNEKPHTLEKAKEEILLVCALQLKQYFEKSLREFDLLLDWSSATEFNVAVWKQMLNIPYGRTTSYSAIAEKIGHPDAIRAVGAAAGHNPIPIVVPCHRVIAKDGKLQGYYYGLDMKSRLLELENPMSFGRQGSLF